MILGIVAPAGQRILVIMGEQTFVGKFNSYTPEGPYQLFSWDEEVDPVYINTERIDAVIPLEEDDDRIFDPSSETVGHILGKHSAKTNGKTEPSN